VLSNVISAEMVIYRVTTHLENLEKTEIAKWSGKMGKSQGNHNQLLEGMANTVNNGVLALFNLFAVAIPQL